MIWANVFADHGMSTPPRHLIALPGRKTMRECGGCERWDEQGLSEYIVGAARNSILSFTTSLTKVSTQVHDFFANINTFLAFERMMRNCLGWMMPAAATSAPMGMAMPQMGMGMAPMGMGMPQMWMMPDWFAFAPAQPARSRSQAHPQPKTLSWFGTEFLIPSQPKPQPATAPRCLSDRGQLAPAMPVFDAMLALSATFLALAPMAMQAWNAPI